MLGDIGIWEILGGVVDNISVMECGRGMAKFQSARGASYHLT